MRRPTAQDKMMVGQRVALKLKDSDVGGLWRNRTTGVVSDMSVDGVLIIEDESGCIPLIGWDRIASLRAVQ
jgi:hypothetical protein